MVTFMLAELKRLRAEGYEEGDWNTFASADAQLREVASKSRYRYLSELYLAALFCFTNKFGDTDVLEARRRLFTWVYSLRTKHQRVQFVTINNHASKVGNRPSALVLLVGGRSRARGLSTEVKGRDQDSEHEKKLLNLLSELVS